MTPSGRRPLITIRVRCCNGADTIERAVGSALRRAWPNTEIVVVDAALTDGSWPISERLARAEDKIRAVRHATHPGYPAALTTIVREARGAYVAYFVDDDDDSHSTRLAARQARLSTYERQFGASTGRISRRPSQISPPEPLPARAITAAWAAASATAPASLPRALSALACSPPACASGTASGAAGHAGEARFLFCNSHS